MQINHRTDNNLEMTRKINDFISHCDILIQPHPEKKPKKYFEVEFEYIEDKTRITQKESEVCYKTSREPENEPKNRYPDVLATEKTRVKLDKEPGCTDYINANFIKKYNGEPRGYITTQGPIDVTVRDFWRMAWQYNIHVLVMLTKEVENGVPKSSRYWPIDRVNEKRSFDNFEITLLSKEKDRKAGDDLVTRKFLVKNSKDANNTREVIHFQYTGWPDHGLAHSHHFLHLMNLVDETVEKTGGGPICIHCSAGIGRTGTFCTIHMNIHKIRNCLKNNEVPEVSVVKTVLKLRKQRHGMVQTKEQYLFCNQIIRDEYNRITREEKEKNEKEKNEKNSNHSQPSSEKPVQNAQPPVQNQNPPHPSPHVTPNTLATQVATSTSSTTQEPGMPYNKDGESANSTMDNSTSFTLF
jgi:protein tyrosine phosphatase